MCRRIARERFIRRSLYKNFTLTLIIMKKSVSLLVCFSLVILVVGCQPKGRGLKVEYVEGVVTLDGTPVSDASVEFLPVQSGSGEAAGGFTNAQGVYKLSSMNGDPEKGAIAGDYNVTVRKIEATSYLNDDGTFKPGAPKDSTGQLISTVQKDILPAVYKDRNKTPVQLTVAPGNNKLNIELKKDAK